MDFIVDALHISIFLKSDLIGENVKIVGVSSLDNLKPNTLAFCSDDRYLENDKNILYLVNKKNQAFNNNISYIVVANPRLAYAKVLNRFFNINVTNISESSSISSTAIIGKNVTIKAGTVVGDNVVIGDNTIINSNVVIHSRTNIGEYCYIKSGAVIGEDGFGFEYDDAKVPIRIQHLGNVIIGDRVEIGANSIIARATIDSTIIGNDVKIDDLVMIAHNCKIGERTLITACVEISGSVNIGSDCWLAPNCSLIQKIKIGNNCILGIGSVIHRNVKENSVMFGNPAKKLRDNL